MFLEPTQDSGRLFVQRAIDGPVMMLNLLRFRALADYSANPELAPEEPITGREAYGRYVEHTEPYLNAVGGRVAFIGDGGHFLIGPTDETWDLVMLIEHRDTATLMDMANDTAYLSGLGHRTAALEDSRLLPIQKHGPTSA